MFEVDLTGLEVGDSIHASTLSLSEGVELTISDRDFTIATIAAPTILTVEEDVVETDGEDAGEGSIDQENEDTETDDDDKTKGDD